MAPPSASCGGEILEPTYTVVLREESEGGFTILVPALPEIVRYGRTVEEAKQMAADAIRCAILGRQDLGERVREEGPTITIPAEDRTGPLHVCRMTSAPLGQPAAHA